MADQPKAPPEKVQAAPAPVAKEKPVTMPVEFASAKDGVKITIESNDVVTVEISRYFAEHIGQFRNIDKVILKFRHGSVPDITGYRER